MTDAHDPDLELDDLASAHLDGLTTPVEAARVESDPALLARVEALRVVRQAIRAVAPVDAARREAAVDAALAAYADEHRSATVTPLAPRRGLSPRATQVLRVAAVVLVIALLVPVVASLVGGSDEEASFNSTGDAISGANDGGQELDSAGGEGADEGVSTTTASPGPSSNAAVGGLRAVSDLGAFEDIDALVVVLGDADVLEPAADAPGPADAYAPAFGCAGPAGDVRAVALVAGDRVAVLILDQDGERTATVVKIDGCSVLAQRTL